jgi:hypothetical protein
MSHFGLGRLKWKRDRFQRVLGQWGSLLLPPQFIDVLDMKPLLALIPERGTKEPARRR